MLKKDMDETEHPCSPVFFHLRFLEKDELTKRGKKIDLMPILNKLREIEGKYSLNSSLAIYVIYNLNK